MRWYEVTLKGRTSHTGTTPSWTRWKIDSEQNSPASQRHSGLEFEERQIWQSPAVAFDPTLIESVRQAAGQAGLSHREITSGAGHDAGYIARVAPTSMIFIPSIGGISHNEAESNTPEQCAQGCQVLLNVVIEHDRRLADRV
jgi:N-carbamoyl-L-amino-acid hydrolase